jgi:aspartyl-tRNA(Asn)/glutamyl-tRNA(Gln) amidotransferase subunit A
VDLIDLTATELVEKLNAREARAVDVTGAFLKAIRARDKSLRTFLHVDEPAAMKQAEAIDSKRDRGETIGKLAGVPVAVKDIFCTAGARTTCGSKILQNFVPPYDAHVIARLRAEDGVVIGKTNMDEFAMGSSTENSAYQVTGNPWDPTLVPGGSSGGSAAAVAAGMAPLALGTDTGGSIRQPAALCGIVGMKPTYGRVSRFGVVAFASSLDQVGPFGHNVRDAALLLEVIAGHDRRDSTSVDRPVPTYSRTIDEPVRPLTIGVAREHFAQGLDPEVERAVRDAIKVYQDQEAKVVDISLPASPYSVAVYYLVATAEASSNLARYDGVHYGHRSGTHKDLIEMYSRSRGEGFGAEVKRRIMLGTYALSSGYKDAYYVKALKVRRLIKEDFDRAFENCDVVVGPTSPTAAFKAGEKVDDPLAMYLTDIYTIAAPLAGIAGISIPCGFTKAGLPIGLHLTGAPFEEEKLLRVARMYERATNWHTRRPKLSA